MTTRRPPMRRTADSLSLADKAARLCKRHARSAVRAALIQYWLKANRLSLAQYPTDSATGRFLHSAPVGKSEKLLPYLEGKHRPTLKDLEGALEALIDAGRRRRQGAVYTPDYIIDYLLKTAVSRRQSDGPPTICDPACGSGGFLLRAARLLSRKYGLSTAEAMGKYVTGFDIDAGAIEHARCLAELFLVSAGESPSKDGLKLFQRDSLLDAPQSLCQQAGVKDGFDVVATNPPYVKLQNLSPSYREQLIRRYRPFVKGSFSLAPLFLLAGRELLSPQGAMALITQNNFFTSLSAEPIRRHLQERRAIWRIVDFGHHHVFANASAYTCLMFLSAESQAAVEYECLRQPPSKASLRGAHYSRISWDRLEEKKWRLVKSPHLDNVQRIEAAGTPLGQLAKISVGFATLKDRVFLVRQRGEHVMATGVDGREVEIEPHLIRPAIKVADLNHQNDLAGVDLRVIFPYHRVEDRYEIIPEDELRRCRRLYRYLSGFRDVLAQRDKGKSNRQAWYAWGRAQGLTADGPKLLTKTFDRRPNFMLDASDRLFCNGYSVSLRPETAPSLSIELLQRILNSRLMHYYARLTSFQIEGGYQCYQKNFIERFALPRLSIREAKQLEGLRDAEFDSCLTDLYQIPDVDLDDVLENPAGD